MAHPLLQRLHQTLSLLQDYGLAVMGNPRLFWAALRHVLSRKSALAEGLFRATRLPLPPAAPAPMMWGDLVDELAQDTAVLVLGATPEAGSLGVRGQDLPRAVLLLAARAGQVELEVNGQSLQRRGTGFDQAMLTAQRVVLRFADTGQQLQLEPYFLRDSGQWLSANNDNPILRGVYADVFAQPGKTDAATLLAGISLADLARDRAVDVVYTWVNHADPDWAALYARYKPEAAATRISDAAAMSRFHSNDELRYSLRSLAAHLPWARRIHVLTNCAPPDWLDPAQDRLIWVDHSQVIPQDCLPTFNSHVIESCLHRIPGLSEQFLYINDDVFIAKPLQKSDFFTDGGASRAFLDRYGMVSGPVSAQDPDYLNAARNSAALIRETFGFVPTRLHQHTVFALRQSVLAAIETRWPAELAALRQHKFRSPQDLSIASFLYHHYALGTGQAVESHARTAFVKPQDIRWRHHLAQINAGDLETFCLNEGGKQSPPPDWHKMVESFLAQRFARPAPWERH